MRFPSTLTTYVSLLTSTGTLLCCALPILLVSLGFGAVVAGVTSELPWLTTLSRQKEWLFLGSAGLLIAGGWLLYRPGRNCPADPEMAKQCRRLDRWNRVVWWITGCIWLIGFTSAYLLLPIQEWLAP